MLEYQVTFDMEKFKELCTAAKPGSTLRAVRINALIHLELETSDRNDGATEPFRIPQREDAIGGSFHIPDDIFEVPLDDLTEAIGEDIHHYRYFKMRVTDIKDNEADYGLDGRFYDLSRLLLEYDDIMVFRTDNTPDNELAMPYEVCLDDHDETGRLTFDVRQFPYFTEHFTQIQSSVGVPATDVLKQAIDVGLITSQGVFASVQPCEDGWKVTYPEHLVSGPAERVYSTATEVYNDLKENGDMIGLMSWLSGDDLDDDED